MENGDDLIARRTARAARASTTVARGMMVFAWDVPSVSPVASVIRCVENARLALVVTRCPACVTKVC